jgi:hypothetical protein
MIMAAVSLAGAAALASDLPEIQVQTDTGVDFSAWRTFGVVEPGYSAADAAPARQRGTAVNDRRRLEQGEEAIQRTILQALEARGMQPDTTGSPDFFIGYDTLVMAFDDPLSMPGEATQRGFRNWSNNPTVARRNSAFDSSVAFEGRLTVFAVDGQTRQIVWTAVAEGPIRQLRNIEANVHELVSAMMEKMPGG